MVDWRERIEINPDVMTGKPVIKGTRLTVDHVIELRGADHRGVSWDHRRRHLRLSLLRVRGHQGRKGLPRARRLMRILADENLPGKAVQVLRDGGHDVLWIREASPGITDPEIMRIAVEEQRIIVTFDKDFGELAVTGQGQNPPAIILLRISKPSPASTAETISQILSSREDWLGHLTVIDDTHIRMRGLKNWKLP